MESLLVWGILLVGIALGLFVAEVFLPSAGVIALTACIVGIAGVVCLWRVDYKWGLAGLLVLVILSPVIFFWGIQLMPSTRMGRKLIGAPEPEEAERSAEQGEESALLGAEGVCATDLRPIGLVMIDGQRLSASSEGMLIAAGTRVRVIAVDGATIRVRSLA